MEKSRTTFKNRAKILAVVVLFALLSLGGTLAFMTDHEAANNEFTVGKVDFNLYESAWDGEQSDGTYATPSNATASNAMGKKQAENMYAGKEIPKNPAIKNNSKNDAYLRMTVKVPVAWVITADDEGNLNNNGQITETELFAYDFNPGSGMKLLSVDTETEEGYHIYEYIFTDGGDYEIPVPVGHDIPPLFYYVKFANVVGGQIDEDTEFLYVDFKAIQSGGFDGPDAAWAAYQNQSHE